MTPPPVTQSLPSTESLQRSEPICEAPDPCVTVHRLVEDPITQSSYIEETRECFELVRRIPNLDLFQRFPELRERLERLNRRHETIQGSPQTPPRHPAEPRPQTPPPSQAPSVQPIPLRPPPPSPPAAQPPRPRPGRAASTASTVAGVIVGVLGGTAGARAAGAAARAIRRVMQR